MTRSVLSQLVQSKTEGAARNQQDELDKKQLIEKGSNRQWSDPDPQSEISCRLIHPKDPVVEWPKRVDDKKKEWHVFCEHQKTLTSHFSPGKTILLKISRYWAHAIDVLDLNEKKASPEDQPIPGDWLNIRNDNDYGVLHLRKGSYGKNFYVMEDNHDTLPPMVLINGAPITGKSIVGRHLAILLGEMAARAKKPCTIFETAREVARHFFSGSVYRPMNDEPSECSNYDGPTGAKETFVDGRVVVLDVDHLSWARYLEKKDLKAQTNKKSSKRAAHNKPDVHTKAQIASFCSSLAVLKNEKTTAGDCPSRLEDGRRKALQEGLLDEENQKSAVIFTEYLPKSDDYKDTEYVADAYRTAATVFQRRLVPIYLTCSPEEHQRRIECRLRDELGLVKQARAGGAVFPKNQMTAMTPGEVEKAARSLDKQNRSGSELYTFSAPAKFANGRFTYMEPDSKDGPALPKEHHGLCIDTTGLTPRETAVVIRDFIYDVLSGESNRITKIYPTTCEEGERLHEEEKESWIIVNEADWTGPI